MAITRPGKRVRRDDLPPPASRRGQNPVVPDEVEPRRRHKRRELFHEFKRFKDDVRRSIPPAALERYSNRPSGSSDRRSKARGGRAV